MDECIQKLNEKSDESWFSHTIKFLLFFSKIYSQKVEFHASEKKSAEIQIQELKCKILQSEEDQIKLKLENKGLTFRISELKSEKTIWLSQILKFII